MLCFFSKIAAGEAQEIEQNRQFLNKPFRKILDHFKRAFIKTLGCISRKFLECPYKMGLIGVFLLKSYIR